MILNNDADENDKNKENQPLVTQTTIVMGIVVLALMFCIAIWAWIELPAGARIPVHWGIDGQPDGYGGKFKALLLLPLITITTMALLILIPYIAPRKNNIKKSRTAYNVFFKIFLCLMMVVYLVIISVGVGISLNVNATMLCLVGIFFIIFGNYLSKVKSNFFIGIRTPWTLSSELSWYRTHRLASWLFVIIGMIHMIGGISGGIGNLVFGLCIGSLIITIIILIPYSYFIWKNDPERSTK